MTNEPMMTPAQAAAECFNRHDFGQSGPIVPSLGVPVPVMGSVPYECEVL
jgi:hypothetical protein